MIAPTVFAILMMLSPQQEQGPLRLAVTDYWKAVEQGRYYDAVQRVQPSDRDLFIRRRHPALRNWQILAVETSAKDEAEVQIGLEQQIQPQGPFYAVKLRQTWVFSDDRWHLKLERMTEEKLAQLYGTAAGEAEPAWPVVTVSPVVVKMPFLNPRQRGWFRIANGLETPVKVLSVDVDPDRFQLLQSPEVIEPRSFARVRIEYVGEEETKDLTAPLVLRLRHHGETKTFHLTLLYNHVDQATRTMLGLSEEDVRNLKRGDNPRVKRKLPEGIKPPGAQPPPPRRPR